MRDQEVNLLLIDTSTDVCSVAVSKQKEIISQILDDSGERKHASLLPLMIDDALKAAAIDLKSIQAIAYSKGPGSYTGLRVGLSSAKGLCMVLGIPLIGVSTLEALAYSINSTGKNLFIPMIDAGRNEVYHAIYNGDYLLASPASPLILQENSFDKYIEQGFSLILSGDGSIKAKTLLKHSDSHIFGSTKMVASYLLKPAVKKFITSEFENLAYSVPEYLKAPNYKKALLSS